MWKIIFVLLLLSACKTQEDIARDQKVEDLSVQMQDRQKIYSDYTDKIQSLEQRITDLTGKLEESEFKNNQTSTLQLQSFDQRISTMESSFTSLEEKVKEQNDYIQKVLSSLSKLSESEADTKKKDEKKLSPYDEAMNNYRKGRYSTAKTQLQQLLTDKSIKGDQKARVLHNLGMVSYMDKNNEQASIYFSKLFTDYSKSPYIKNGLLFLGKTFSRMSQKDEAKATFEQVIKDFPKTKQAIEAQKLLKSL